MNSKLKNFLLIAFGLLVIIQLWRLGATVNKQNSIMDSAQSLMFAIDLGDPYDAFRGRYMQISCAMEVNAVDDNTLGDSQVNVEFEKNALGFAKIKKYGDDVPADAECVLKCYGRLVKKEGEPNKIIFELPFNKYFGNERKVLAAEKYIADNPNVRGVLIAKIYNGKYFMEDLLIDGKSLSEF